LGTLRGWTQVCLGQSAPNLKCAHFVEALANQDMCKYNNNAFVQLYNHSMRGL
jgi:hypothetical protein